MTEESQTIVDPEVSKGGETVEEIAMSKGWKPAEEWDGEPDAHIGAKEFLDREPFFERIRSQSSEIKRTKKELSELKETIKELAEHHQNVREIEYKRAMEDLKARRKEAFETGDYDRLEEVEDKMKELSDINEKQPSKAQGKESSGEEVLPEVQDWMEENSWYNEDPVRKAVLEACLQQVIDKNPDITDTPRKALEEATKLAKKEVPGRFGLERNRSSSVIEPGDSDTRVRSGRNKFSARHLSEEQRAVGKRFIATGAVKSLDEYAQQLGEIGGFDN